jgi:hypothetical protein
MAATVIAAAMAMTATRHRRLMNLSPKWIPLKFENENSLLLDQVNEIPAVSPSAFIA